MGFETVKIIGHDPDGQAKAVAVSRDGHLPAPSTDSAWWNGALAQTKTVIWTPTPGHRIILDGVAASADTAMNVEFVVDGITFMPPLYIPANGGFAIDFHDNGYEFPAGAELGFTSSAAGNHSVFAWGREENA